jgi:predicted CoA-substrate-specific enzyme activase
MTITAGCDVGSLTTKAVVLKNRMILGTAIIKSGPRPAESAATVMEKIFEDTRLSAKNITYCVGTGYGREKIPFVDQALSEISCHARGARWMVPSARTLFDIGGQDCKVIQLDKEGRVEKFATNDKCASGTGRFLDVMATSVL